MSPVIYADGGYWRTAEIKPQDHVFPFYAVELDLQALREHLQRAPKEGEPQGVGVILPLPDGRYAEFEAFDSPVMAPELAEKFPLIRTYKVRGVDEPAMSGRISLTNEGFSALLTTAGKSVQIEHESVFADTQNEQQYRVFYKQDLPNIPKPVEPPGEHRPESSQAGDESSEEEHEGFFSRLLQSIKHWF